jgi:hypothetical protein
MADFLKVRTITEARIYRNQVLKDWIDTNFDCELLRSTAWATVRFIKETWPEKSAFLMGDLIHEDIREE